MDTTPNRSLHKYAVFTALATFFLLIAGALVTSNGAGLSIPDWPLAFGSLVPPMMDGVRYEYIHRVIAHSTAGEKIGLGLHSHGSNEDFRHFKTLSTRLRRKRT